MSRNVITKLANEFWTSVLRMGSPRVTPNALKLPRPMHRRTRACCEADQVFNCDCDVACVQLVA